MPDIPQAIRTFILTELIADDEIELAPGEPIFSAGLLDSFAVLQLMRFLEDRFRVIIPIHEVTLSDFDSIDKIVALVKKRSEVVPTA